MQAFPYLGAPRFLVVFVPSWPGISKLRLWLAAGRRNGYASTESGAIIKELEKRVQSLRIKDGR